MESKTFKRYLVVASRFGDLHVAVVDNFTPMNGDVVVHRAYTIDEAFDWKEDMQSRIARLNGHCATCD